ncbi:class I SAM-dependent methyltransferase [Meridianimarinicoccus sp. MJW13]|uniref:class I SAM-dependent methyltransferase n=1 Tax=Meridianimarinicoccus sp. MJW13 TaxID=2720031 RepID=UPI0018662B15|nr:class I SAM-dependent methyltransferase [Fluviibacterium sp. MJW13]
MKDATQFWDGVAPGYAKSRIRDMDAYTYTLDRTRSYLRDSDRVLELGCGTGSTALQLADGVGSYLATDLSGAMIGIGRDKATVQGADNLAFRQCDALAAGVEGPFDAVLGLNLLHLVPDARAVMARAHELLAPGGLLITKTPCLTDRNTPLKIRAMLLALPIAQLLGKAPAVNFLKIAELEEATTAAGFDIIETGNYPARPPSRYIVARKR